MNILVKTIMLLSLAAIPVELSAASSTSSSSSSSALSTTAVRLKGSSFGTQAHQYTLGRKLYPAEVFRFIKGLCPENSSVLDLGCGNGRATLELCKAGLTDVTGYDIDSGMLAEAKKRAAASDCSIKFINDCVINLRTHFSSVQWPLITAFTAFHWFCSPEEIAAIRSVLSPRGFFVVVRCDEDKTNFLKDACQEFIEKELGHQIVRNGKGKKLAEILSKNQFKIQTKEFSIQETYSVQELKDKIRSHSIWTELSESDKERIWSTLEKFIESKLNNKPLTVSNTYRCIVAQKIESPAA